MSCAEVMYPAHGPCAPYTSASSFSVNSLQVFGGGGRMQKRVDSVLGTGAASFPGSGEGGEKDKQAPEAKYLSSRCVLFTYYQGDISSVVDEHFSRALSSYMEGDGKKRVAELGSDSASPSSRRSFPPSFWDSSYPSPSNRGHSDGAAYSIDPYSPALHPGLPPPHPSESWAYPPSPAYAPPRPLHELYSPAGLEPHYSPLLMPTVRPSRLPPLPGHYDVTKLDATPAWPGLIPASDVAQTLTLNIDTGLQHHKKAKELYWF
ncbi:transcription cofactor vestigial-like protein 2b [Lepisosteus oculatus]|uniref:Vestigial-like family member 2b n=1 Tax=Lepisosteus oculatus TaxID=7918 RepID=W5MDI3_LEPOC|nr:PREDICTED: transcription cofactor vestigial-like protein 2 [Lepisosteus oculatus]